MNQYKVRVQISEFLRKVLATSLQLWTYRNLILIKKGLEKSSTDPFEIDLNHLRKLMGEAHWIVEAGTFDGTTARELSFLFPEAVIFSFEPDRKLFIEALLRNIGFKNIYLQNCGLGAQFEYRKFNESHGKHRGVGSFLKPTGIQMHNPEVKFIGGNSYPLMISSMDEFLSSAQIPYLDLIWLDVQGSEFDVFRGASKYLKSTRFVYVEVSTKEMYEGATLKDEIVAHLKNYGFEILNEYFLPSSPEGNLLFHNPKFDKPAKRTGQL